MKKNKVSLDNGSYEIVIGSGILENIGAEMSKLGLKGQVLVVSNTTVAPFYGNIIIDALDGFGYTARMLVLPDGEKYKNFETVVKIFDAAIECGLDRSSTILALGGGVIGDMAGLAAATYMRGINFVQVPTTLLAQVDASIGGKVAVNHPRGKNLVGCFYQPKLVWIDIDTLKTLSQREMLSGWAEVIKYGVISDYNLFCYLEENIAGIKERSDNILIKAVSNSCAIKAEVVSQDEKEHGIRAILNFGHTIGHALESATNYCELCHGEAVGIGMVGASYLAHQMGMISLSDFQRIRSLIINVGLPTNIPGIIWEKIWHHMKTDKKAQNGNINFILPTSIGSVIIKPVEPLLIKEAVLKNTFRR